MYISFGRKLRGLGNVRIGFRMKGSQGCLFLGAYWCINAFIYLFWYTLLGTFWLMYGLGYLCYYLPVKAIIKYYKKKKQEAEIAEAARKYDTPSQPENDAN